LRDRYRECYRQTANRRRRARG